MNMHPVESSHLAAVGFDGTTLEVRFTDGSLYRYRGNAELLRVHYWELRTTDKVGAYFAKHVKSSKELQAARVLEN